MFEVSSDGKSLKINLTKEDGVITGMTSEDEHLAKHCYYGKEISEEIIGNLPRGSMQVDFFSFTYFLFM